MNQESADQEPSAGAAVMHEVASGVFAWVQPDGSWWINNAGAVIGRGDSFIVDTCATHVRTRRFLAALDEVRRDAPIRLAVNTHQHGDHTYGNSLLPASTVLIGHENMRAGLDADPVIDGCPPFWHPVPDWGPVRRRLPDLTVRDRLTVHVDGRRIELLHPGEPAHTTGDLVAWLPEQRVLFAGDLVFHGLTPLVFMGSVTGALRSLDWLAGFRPAFLIPGHGEPLADDAIGHVLDAHRRYYRFVLQSAETGRANGWSPLETAQRCDLGAFAGWPDAERIVLNLHRAYADSAGTELDLIAALSDAVTWLGRPMATAV